MCVKTATYIFLQALDQILERALRKCHDYCVFDRLIIVVPAYRRSRESETRVELLCGRIRCPDLEECPLRTFLAGACECCQHELFGGALPPERRDHSEVQDMHLVFNS